MAAMECSVARMACPAANELKPDYTRRRAKDSPA